MKLIRAHTSAERLDHRIRYLRPSVLATLPYSREELSELFNTVKVQAEVTSEEGNLQSERILYACLDRKGRAALLPAHYLFSLAQQGKKERSRETVVRAIMQHCAWIERAPRFEGLSMDEAIASLHWEDMRDWIDELRLRNLDASTVHNYEVLVRGFYEWLRSEEAGSIRKDVPWPGRYFASQPARRRPRFVTKEQVIRLLSQLHNENQRCAIHLMYDSGLRISELVDLRLGDLPNMSQLGVEWCQTDYVPLCVRGVKARARPYKERYTLMSQAVLARIHRYHNTDAYQRASGWTVRDPNKPAFLNVRGQPLTAAALRRAMAAACDRLRLEEAARITPHRLRHGTAFAVLRSELGDSLLEKLNIIQSQLGHAHPSTTEHYVTLTSVVTAIRSHRDIASKAQEADEILAATYLPERKHAEKRGHWA